MRLSDRQFWTDFMDAKGVPEDQRYAFIQAIDKSEREPREKTAEKLGPSPTRSSPSSTTRPAPRANGSTPSKPACAIAACRTT